MNVQEMRVAYDEAVAELNSVADEIEALPDDADDATIERLGRSLDATWDEVTRRKANLERVESINEARAQAPPLNLENEGKTKMSNNPISVGREESTYRADGGHSWVRDLVYARTDPEAAERLLRNQRERLETRDVTSADPGAAGFIPPIYLEQAWAELPRATRPFADVVPKMPLPEAGLTLSVPKVQTGVTVASQSAENAAVSETDIDTQTITATVNTLAGQNDISIQSLERSAPGMDLVIFNDLKAAYDAQLDTQLLSGSGSSGQHAGIRSVAGRITVSYTDGTPTAAKLLPKIYDAIQQVASNRYLNADTIVMHPRRSAWLASNLSSTFPLFQVGTLTQATGTQDGGFATSFGGLRVVLDANIGTTYGAGTNEDEIYVVRSADLILAEGPLRTRVLADVLSGSLTVRLQLFAYSAFVPNRQAKAIGVISGTGLTAPTFA